MEITSSAPCAASLQHGETTGMCRRPAPAVMKVLTLTVWIFVLTLISDASAVEFSTVEIAGKRGRECSVRQYKSKQVFGGNSFHLESVPYNR